MEVTLQDIAQQLDISAATVSRSLRNDALIKPETRARVNETAQRMGYKGRARRPRNSVEKGTSHALGLLLRSNSLDAARNDINLMKMMAGMMAVTDANRALLHVHTIHHDEQRHLEEDASVVPPMIQQGLCQALIAHGDHDPRDLAFLARRMAVVSMGRIYRTLPIDAAVGDNAEGMRALVAHLVELGHRRLAWVGSHYSATFIEARQAGFIQGCIEHQLELRRQYFFGPEIFEGHEIRDRKAVFAAVKAGVTGFVCGNDAVASTIIEVLESAGHRVPQDVSVAGFDAVSSSKRRITSVDPHFFDIGQAAARLAIQRITQPMAQPCILSVRCETIPGETTGPPPK